MPAGRIALVSLVRPATPSTEYIFTRPVIDQRRAGPDDTDALELLGVAPRRSATRAPGCRIAPSGPPSRPAPDDRSTTRSTASLTACFPRGGGPSRATPGCAARTARWSTSWAGNSAAILRRTASPATSSPKKSRDPVEVGEVGGAELLESSASKILRRARVVGQLIGVGPALRRSRGTPPQSRVTAHRGAWWRRRRASSAGPRHHQPREVEVQRRDLGVGAGVGEVDRVPRCRGASASQELKSQPKNALIVIVVITGAAFSSQTKSRRPSCSGRAAGPRVVLHARRLGAEPDARTNRSCGSTARCRCRTPCRLSS